MTDYYEDIQKIENAPADISRELVMVADRVDNLSVDRRILNTPDSRLSNNAYRNMEMYEAEFPEAVAKLRSTEDDRNTIARDIRMVKTERSMYRMEAKELVNKQLRIKGYAQLICGLLAAIFAVFMVIMAVTDGIEDFVSLSYQGEFSYLSLNGEDFSQVEKKLMLPDSMEAPVEEGEKAGVLRYELKGKVLGEVEIVTEGAVKKAGYRDYLKKLRRAWMMEYSDNVSTGGK